MDNSLYFQINETKRDYTLDQTIHSLFEKNAEEIPDLTALVEANYSITFSELNRRANRIAHKLIEEGVKLETPVAIFLPRGIDFTVCMIAVLKAGGCFIALEVDLPAARIQNILEDLEDPLVLTNSLYNHNINKLTTRCLLTDDIGIQAYSDKNPELEIPSTSLVYMIYTSGSTGKPKGVMIEHHNLVNLELWNKEEFGLPHGTRVTQTAKISFDASMWEFWCSLTSGYTLYFLPHDIELDFNRLQDWFKLNKIEACFLPTAVAELFVETYKGECHDLKHICAGGDKLHVKPKASFCFDLFNVYGPAECTIICITAHIKPEETFHSVPPIGRPIANSTVWILDENMQLVPPGEIGEMYLGGECVGRGYYKRPDLTEKAYIEGSKYGLPPGIIYKSGDLGRLCPEDGMYECLGRVDNQVKIRGYRIELGEIDSTLALRNDINQCVAIVRNNPMGEPNIVTYYTSSIKNISTSVLKKYLSERLPIYMVPEYFVQLDEFPLTHNQKIDRKILPDPEWAQNRSTERTESYQNEIEKNIARVWKEVLQVKYLNRNDDFYELGGHSLKAGMIVTRLQNRFGYDINLKDFLKNTTIAELASVIKPNDNVVRDHILEYVPRAAEGYPVTYGQQGLWHFWLLDPKRIDYNIPLRVDIKGELSIDALRKSLKYLVERYESLHTRFDDEDGEIKQYINTAYEVELPFEDLTAESPDDRESRIQRSIKKLGKVRFDLRKGNLYDFHLIKTNPNEFILLITIHHIATDGWSMGIFMTELYQIYETYLANNNPHLVPPEFQSIDFAVWERKEEPKQRFSEQLNYWRKLLLPFPEDIDLPKKNGYTLNESHSGKRKWWSVGGDRYRKLKQFCNQFECSSFVVMMAILDVVLYRYTQQSDIVVGSPFANRNHTDKEKIFGLSTNLLAHRLRLKGDDRFSELLLTLNETCTSNYINSDYPFDQLLKDLGYKAQGSKHPLFQVMMVYQNYPLPQAPKDKTSFRLKEIGNNTSKMDLVFNAEEFPDEMECWFEYNDNLYDDSLIERMSHHFHNVMDRVFDTPEIEISSISIITGSESYNLFREWQGPERDYPLNKTYSELLTQSFEKHAENIALRFYGNSFTYRELEIHINSFVLKLLHTGVQTGDIVGICLDRTPEAIISIMAVVQSGCAYLPINPTFPQDRLRRMLQLAGVKTVITAEKYLDLLSVFDGTIIKYDEQNKSEPTAQVTIKTRQLHASDPAYVLFTSGSTGNPKGIAVTHRNLLNHNFAFIEKLNLTADDKVLQFGNLSFDLSVEEIFPTLLCGATLVLRTEKIVSSFPEAMQFIEEEQITVLDLPTAYWHEMVHELAKTSLPDCVRTVIIGGEKAAADVYDIWEKNVKSDIQLLNTYGPTEATIIATWQDASQNKGDEFLIGKPLPNYRVYVLDNNLQPLPPGIPGELYIGGAGVAKGYIGQPELTSQVFIDHRFPDNSRDRIYKTGDIVRFTPDGALEFIGRKDFQIKIRGHRIEPEEIEANLRKLSSIRDAVVLPVPDNSGDMKLSAYYMSESGKSMNASQIIKELDELLPKYMIPHYFVHMKDFPMTSTGKINRKGFPSPDLKAVEKAEKKLPFTPDQELLCNIIAEVLGVDSVGVNENFFELGGNSILSMKVINQVGKAGLILRINDLFNHKDLEDLSTKMSHKEVKGSTFGSFSLIELQKGSPERTPLYLLHSLPGDLLGYVNLIRLLDRKQPVYGLQALGLFDAEKAHSSIQGMASYYAELIKQHCKEKKLFLSGWCFGGNVAYEIAGILTKDGFEIPDLILIDSWVKKPVGILGWKFFNYKVKCLMKMIPGGIFKYMRSKLTEKKDYEKLVCNNIQFLDQGLFANRTTVRLKNIDAIIKYRMKAYNGNIVLFSALHQDMPLLTDVTLGWPSITKNLEITYVDSTHDTILKEPAVRLVAQVMNQILNR
ncbi:MAG: amino acid adenylation domain-containing protein [Candidatus Cloacimonetes bacterium]|nr:amino acid adenylation domain-containing protein [Candidatus Cloacimonadota bacterium]